jgi:hypothetical protein
MALVINAPQKTKIDVDLEGPDGNAFQLVGIAIGVAKQIGWDRDDIAAFRTKCYSGDYGNVLALVDKNFGDFINLEMSERYALGIQSKAFRAHFLNELVEVINEQ